MESYVLKGLRLVIPLHAFRTANTATHIQNEQKQELDWNSASVGCERIHQTLKNLRTIRFTFYVSGVLAEDYYVANKLMRSFIGGGNIDNV